MVVRGETNPFLLVSEAILGFSDKWLKIIDRIILFSVFLNVMVFLLCFNKFFIQGEPTMFTAEALFERAAIFLSVVVLGLSVACWFLREKLRARAVHYVEKFNGAKKESKVLSKSGLRSDLNNMTYFGAAFVKDVSVLLYLSMVNIALLVWVVGFALTNYVMLGIGGVTLVLALFVSLHLVKDDEGKLDDIFLKVSDVEF